METEIKLQNFLGYQKTAEETYNYGNAERNWCGEKYSLSLNPPRWYPESGKCEPIVKHLCAHRSLY